jgi:hypothetical protein
MDSMVQRLTQMAVADIDQKWKNWSPPAAQGDTVAAKKTKKKHRKASN